MTLVGDTCRDSVTECSWYGWRRGYLLIWRRCYGHAASAADQCASLLLDEAVETVALSLELPSRYLSFAELFILLWKKESMQVWTRSSGKAQTSRYCRLLSADAADDNVEDRSLSVFCFSVRYCIIADNIWSIRTHMYCMRVSFCMHYVFANTCNY